jgi:SAM-dependent methyltransferase
MNGVSKTTSDDAEFDAYSADYKALVNASLVVPGFDVDYFTKVKAEYLKDLIAESFGTSAVDGLDLGCGIGNSHKLLRPSLRSLAGIDVSKESIELARAHNPEVSYSWFNGLELPFAEETFDVVFAVCVFHHVPVENRVQLANEARRVLRPDGIFVVFEHNPRNPLTMRIVNNCVFDKNADLLKPDETEWLLEKTGHQQVSTRHILTIPSFNSATRKIDRLLGKMPLGAQYFTMGRRS